MDRKWIVLAALAVTVVLAAGCSSNPEPTPLPKVVETPPPVEVPAETAPAPMADVEETPPPESIQELQARLETQGLLGDVYYEFDKYDLRAQDKERLARNAEFMNGAEGRGLTFTIEGHCDERGTNEYNLALGQNRTTAALDYLVSLGVEARRFKTISYGEERPFCTESSEACWQRNRRAHFVVSSTGG